MDVGRPLIDFDLELYASFCAYPHWNVSHMSKSSVAQLLPTFVSSWAPSRSKFWIGWDSCLIVTSDQWNTQLAVKKITEENGVWLERYLGSRKKFGLHCSYVGVCLEVATAICVFLDTVKLQYCTRDCVCEVATYLSFLP